MRVFTAEHKRKLSEANKGNILSKETKLKISEANKGEKNSMFGKHHTEETKQLIAAVNKGNKYWLGKKHTKTTKQKLSEHRKGTYLSEETKLKIGAAGKGRVFSEDSRKKKSESLKGEKCWNWKGGITPINQTIRASVDTKIWRKTVYARDNYTCQYCGDSKGGNLNAHHIKSFTKYSELRFEVSNGITICEDCHRKKGFHNPIHDFTL